MQEQKLLKRQYLSAMKVMNKCKLARITSLMFGIEEPLIMMLEKRGDNLNEDVRRKFYNQPNVSTTIPDKLLTMMGKKKGYWIDHQRMFMKSSQVKIQIPKLDSQHV